MKKLMFVVTVLLSYSAFSQELDPGIDAVKTWKTMGPRWAVGYDRDNLVIGVFDLSYAMPWTKVKVGSLTSPRVKAWDVLKVIKEGEVEPADQDLENKAEKELAEKGDSDLDGTLLPDDWRQHVPWKASMRAQSDIFSLSDFDMQKVVKEKDLKEFNKELEYAMSLIKDGEDLQFLGDLFSQIQIAQDGKNFEIYFSPAIETAKISKPKKIANLRNPKLSFLEAMKFELLKKSIGQLTKFIINPIVKAFVETAISRVFHFVKVVNFSHYHMSLEVLADVSDASGLFPTNVLTEQDKVHMAESLEFAQSSLTMSWKWAFKKPFKEWASDREDQIAYGQNAQKWLSEKSVNFVLINPRFSTVNAADLVVLALKKIDKKKGPFTPYVDGKMSPYRGKRIATEVVSAAVVFGTNFIPFVGGLLETLYKKVVESPMDKQRYWEARLTAVLEQRQAAMGEDWSTQLASLDGQRVNPFFKKRSDMEKLIEARKKAYDIP
jgi:hypothetical protein